MRKILLAGLAGSAMLLAEHEAIPRIKEAAEVLNQIMAAPDKGIPQDLIGKAECIAIAPDVKKGAFIVGAQYGKGVMVCRAATASGWSGPSTIRVEGGSFGAQIGGGETDMILLVMNKQGAEKLMRNEFKLGASAGAMAGPVGRTAAADTDAAMNAQILSYSRSRGVFAGVSLDGSTLRSDDKDNEAIYGKPVTHKDILMGKVTPPATAQPLYATINRYTGKKGTDTERSRTEKRK
jgi:lipid-binding SYLF domain-containing protein